MEILIVILVYAAFLYAVYKIAKSKNREPAGWMLASLIISPIIIIIILAIMQTLPGKKKLKLKRKKLLKKLNEKNIIYNNSSLKSSNFSFQCSG